MAHLRGAWLRLFTCLALFSAALAWPAQTPNSASVHGAVTDPTGAVIPGATVELTNRASGFERKTTTDSAGQFTFSNIPLHDYQIQATAPGFAAVTQTAALNSPTGTEVNLVMHIAASSQTVTVQASGPLVEDTSTFHTDVDRDQFNKIPLESVSSGLSSLVTETTPGVTADSNGLFHGMGDHASNSFSIDGQPVTDQQSKVFSNQLPTNAVQSIRVIEGAPPAQYGDKTSLVIVATTRSGQGVTKPTGSFYGSYGSFGTANSGFNLSYGKQNWGNFIEIDGLNTGRFLDPPEFSVFHDKGNEENAFDRADYSFNANNSVHLNLNYSRSWFQNPNAYDNLNVRNILSGGSGPGPVVGVVGNTDQRSQILTYNIAPSYTRVLSQHAVMNVDLYTRHDNYHYFPSPNPLADLGPANLQTSSITQARTLSNSGARVQLTWNHGPQNVIAGAEYYSTLLREHDGLGIVESVYNSPCMNATTGVPVPGYSTPADCAAASLAPNPNYLPALRAYDITRGGGYYHWFGHADIKELSLYIEDQIKLGNWQLSLGIRGDKYNGLAAAGQAEPRLGVAYQVKQTGTVLGVSYARTLESPFNENLVLSSEGCSDAVLAPLLSCTPGISGVLQPGYRNEYHVSVQQGLGKYVVLSGEYIWKYTTNAADFAVLGNTPITFPIDWHNSKIPGYALHANVASFHNITAYMDASSVAARFFPPQVAGAGATVGHVGLPFRIDHDEKFNETTHVQYTLGRGGKFLQGIWGGLNWRFDSGMVAGATPCYGLSSLDPNTPCINSTTMLGGQQAIAMVDNNIPASVNPVTGAPVALPFTADEEFEAGLMCNGQKATPTMALPAVCPANQLTSTLLNIPAPNTGDNDHNPPRMQPRSLFDVDLGKNNIFDADHYKINLDVTAINITNKYALYNFLSTFSGTHYVTPRALTAKVTLNF